jgi:hypothetical protein
MKISKYVDYLMHVSSKYLTSSILHSLTCRADRTSCVPLAYVIPNLACAIYSTHAAINNNRDRFASAEFV